MKDPDYKDFDLDSIRVAEEEKALQDVLADTLHVDNFEDFFNSIVDEELDTGEDDEL